MNEPRLSIVRVQFLSSVSIPAPIGIPNINPEPVVVAIEPGGYTKTEETDRCPVEECSVTFSSNNNPRAITIDVGGMVKKGQ
jgi:hypothetical protein